MGAVANAGSLLTDPTWRNWVTAAAAFVAVEVYSEAPTTPDHAIRLRLALDVITVPNMVTDRLVTLCSVTQEIAALGGAPTANMEGLLITRIRALWTDIAKTTYPPETP